MLAMDVNDDARSLNRRGVLTCFEDGIWSGNRSVHFVVAVVV
jgi:hypothetical protein